MQLHAGGAPTSLGAMAVVERGGGLRRLLLGAHGDGARISEVSKNGGGAQRTWEK
jgi:hypothetical protein